MWLRAKIKVNLNPELKKESFLNNLRENLMEWGLSMKTTAKSSFENFQKQLPFKEIYVTAIFRGKQQSL